MTVNDLVAKIVLETVTKEDFLSISSTYQELYILLELYRETFLRFGKRLGVNAPGGFAILKNIDSGNQEGDDYIEVLHDEDLHTPQNNFLEGIPITEIIIYE
jgi:hypothetical protein